ncbi:MAG: hypothetical protein HY894_08270 [Deltaproteobacteria bacterium]|nr:hypothetical protein [Deltaproteobacteria bacterium]
MASEFTVSAVLVEQEDGSYRANCPDLDVAVSGRNPDDALGNLKDAVAAKIRTVGADKVRMNAVKCLKVRVTVD